MNAEIVEISNEVKGFVVKSLDGESILGENCYVNCEGADTNLIYVNYDTTEIIDLKFEDFIVGDEITLDVKTVENKSKLHNQEQGYNIIALLFC